MKKITFLLVTLAITMITSFSFAFAQERHKTFGMDMDVGVPDGAAAGLVLRPYVNWARLTLAGTYNGMAPGIRGGVTWDMIDFGISPSLTLEGGHYWKGKLPGISQMPEINYDYINLHLGIEFGSRDNFRFFIHGGPSWIKLRTYDFQSSLNIQDSSVSISDPTINARILPTAKLGIIFTF